jgi:hypothetical protein
MMYGADTHAMAGGLFHSQASSQEGNQPIFEYKLSNSTDLLPSCDYLGDYQACKMNNNSGVHLDTISSGSGAL